MSLDLFDLKNESGSNVPLAARMRPLDFDGFIGQESLLAPGKPLRRDIEQGNVRSMILWGPPGCGKTTLARIIARRSEAAFETLHAANEGTAELRQKIALAQERLKFHNRQTILFIDEIHRFNKAQQDALLPHVEQGDVILIGATAESPSFEIIAPLLSRAPVVPLQPLEPRHIRLALQRALDAPTGLAPLSPDVEPPVLERICQASEGDARAALNMLETAVSSAPVQNGRRVVRLQQLNDMLKRRSVGKNHYELASALIKSIRGSDPDAALYWLARMILAGEDPKFIARRLVISASEDIGNADPAGLTIATSAAHAVEYVGMPEAQICLAQAVSYLASAPKSNASYAGLNAAKAAARDLPAYPVPTHLRNAPTQLHRELGYGDGYRYGHDSPDGFLPQQHLPAEMRGTVFYEPKAVGAENAVRKRLQEWRRRRHAESAETSEEDSSEK